MSRVVESLTKTTKPFTSPRANVIELEKALAGCQSVLDIGCGPESPMRLIKGPYLYGLEAFEKDIKRARERQTHDEFILSNGFDVDKHFKPKQVEGCLLYDVIEHFTKEDGMLLLKKLEAIATKRVVVFTPNGYLFNAKGEQDDFQEHKSGWTPSEMSALGYRVIGLNGWKKLRGEKYALRWKPAPFWLVISMLSHYLWCRNHPEGAMAMLCVKELG